MIFEKPYSRIPALKDIVKDCERNTLSNALVAFLFTQTGPIAILLSAAQTGGLTDKEMVTWLFAGYGLGGLLTIFLSLLYRQPVSAAWSLPAAAIVGASLGHLSFPQVIGAYIVTGIIITIIGITGIARTSMDFIPLPIIMGMIAGVFLPFGLKLVSTFSVDPLLAFVTVGVFFLFSSGRIPAAFIPPILVATIAGGLLIAWRGGFNAIDLAFSVTSPVFYKPEFNLGALLELVFPLTISVIGIHNTQGIGILKREGFIPPVNVMTLSCGLGSIFMGILGSVPTCITGPVSAILNSSGKRESRYAGSAVFGFLLFLSGLFAPVAIGLALMAPVNLINLLGGLALMRVLLDSFHSAFKSNFILGALVAFLVTISNVTFFNIGSAFWGLVGGCLFSILLEPEDYKNHLKALKAVSIPSCPGKKTEIGKV